MKRIICAVLVAVMALALAVSASAATKQDVIDKFEASVPENYRAVHQLCPDLLIPLLKRQWLRFQVCDEQPDVSLLCDSQQLSLFLFFQLRTGCFVTPNQCFSFLIVIKHLE